MRETVAVPSDEVAATLSNRRISEPSPSIRSEAQRDRDRILYSSAFLRLGHVTQVASPEAGHIFHSRLTHTIKVGQVARGLAQRLKALAAKGEMEAAAIRLVDLLDEDATEAAALAHDLGHPPFGHLAEGVLQKMAKEASFEGNPQSFRIVSRLALRTNHLTDEGAPIGLNLTRRTQNGLLKYPWLREEIEGREKKWGAYSDSDKKAFEWTREGFADAERSLEAALMDWADDVTYAVHDMEDFYRAGLIPLELLSARHSPELARFKEYLQAGSSADTEKAERLASAAESLFGRGAISFDRPFGGLTEERVALRRLTSRLIGIYVAAPTLIVGDDNDIQVEIDDQLVDQVAVLKKLTWYYVIDRPSLSVIQRGQRQIVESLFGMYSEAIERGEPQLLPPLSAERMEKARGDASKQRVIVDLIAGMTEPEAAEIYRRSQAITSGSVLIQTAGPV